LKNTKKLVISFVISLCLVLIFEFVLNSYFKSDNETIYVLRDDIYKGERITKDSLKSITVSSKLDMKSSFNVDYVDKVAKENLPKGKVISNSDVINKEDCKETEDKYEYVSIEVKDLSQGLAYQLRKRR